MERPSRTAILAFLLLISSGLAGCSGSTDDDGDDDGIHDSLERLGWQIAIDMNYRREYRHVTSDPGSADGDGDGIPDAFERAIGSDPLDPDTDDDGLTDCQEAFHTVRAECEDPLWTGQGDGGYGTNPARDDSDPGYSRYVNHHIGFADVTGTVGNDGYPWGDGVPDGSEVHGYQIDVNGVTKLITTDPMNSDSDGDRLEDGEEWHLFNSDPTVADTDGDGCADGFDTIPSARESVAPGLQQFQLAAGLPAMDVRVRINIAGTPSATELQRGSGGQTLTWDPLSDVRPESCRGKPQTPWLPVEVLVEGNDGAGFRLLDVTSGTNPGGAFRVQWHLDDATWHFDDPALALAGSLHWSGVDGTIELQPATLLAQAS